MIDIYTYVKDTVRLAQQAWAAFWITPSLVRPPTLLMLRVGHPLAPRQAESWGRFFIRIFKSYEYMTMTIARITTLVCILLTTIPCAAEPNRLIRNDSQLLIYWQGNFEAEQKNKMLEWLDQAMDTMLLLNGEPPRETIRIELKSIAADEPVPFARVLRSEPQGILFYINPNRPLDEFINDWTAYHEFTHLYIENPGPYGIWFSEGLASYYQNILQSRAGLLSASKAISKLRKGFESGRNDNRHADLTLEQLSYDMREYRAYMRVYWSGALYFLQADLALRNSINNNPDVGTLDDVLRVYGECCLSTKRRSALSIAEEFDRIAGQEIFVPLYESYRVSTSIPDYESFMNGPTIDRIFSGQRPIQ